MNPSSASPAPSRPLKRKASSETPTEPTDVDGIIDPHDPVLQTLSNDAHRFNTAYSETTAAMRDLLEPGSASPTTGIDYTTMAIIDDLKRRPELAKMDDSKAILEQCGIGLEVRVGRDGKEKVVVRFKGKEV
ncbi:hypothetical protein BGW36DRAFT_87364 [Talaromyces proteolyticus]|uniref:Uncharacterized protein n=1 Tax=Talaromyces proteolyticus TaxID=1131652 RepID=A0AAD4L3E5_9EURO|nr:uncharacterized protein BGW36DRAFT_87364 [Talaromyces proteolyticus]KAH8703483.1 hypothetical protein BGW36DRAFT_87364 [Talaromyces proteolyticus]